CTIRSVYRAARLDARQADSGTSDTAAACSRVLALHRQAPPVAAKHESDHGIVGCVDQCVLNALISCIRALAVEPGIAEPGRFVRHPNHNARLAAVKDVLGAVLDLSLDHDRPHLGEDGIEGFFKTTRSFQLRPLLSAPA